MKNSNIKINGVEYAPVSKVKAKSTKKATRKNAFNRLKTFMVEKNYKIENVKDNQNYTRKSDGRVVKGKIVTFSNKGQYFVTDNNFWRVN